ncbi:hypothetical protein AX17_006421 [Amanita inopinata Kibby_2008]|nr:hypothetical protein AX17_006421 [Amanita inopinata Kibby_2008]
MYPPKVPVEYASGAGEHTCPSHDNDISFLAQSPTEYPVLNHSVNYPTAYVHEMQAALTQDFPAINQNAVDPMFAEALSGWPLFQNYPSGPVPFFGGGIQNPAPMWQHSPSFANEIRDPRSKSHLTVDTGVQRIGSSYTSSSGSSNPCTSAMWSSPASSSASSPFSPIQGQAHPIISSPLSAPEGLNLEEVMEKAQVASKGVIRAASARRKKEAKYECEITGCGQRFTESHNLKCDF